MDTVIPVESSPPRVLCLLDLIPDGGATAIEATLAHGEESVILLRRGEQVSAFLNICPHAGNRLDYAPGKFLLKNGTLICAVHGAVFNQADGLCTGGPCRGQHLRAVSVCLIGNTVCLDRAGEL